MRQRQQGQRFTLNIALWRPWMLAGVLLLAGCASGGHHPRAAGLPQQYGAGLQERVFDNIVIHWVPSASTLNVTVTMGTALIEQMQFTPDTLRKEMNYSNPPQIARAVFTVEFNTLGNGGKIYCENFEWKTTDNNSTVTGLLGTWQVID